jgi:hypothetical protein
MVRNEAKKPVPYQALGVSLMIAVLILPAVAVHAQDQNGQACIDTLGYAACDSLGKPNPNAPRQMIVLHFAALAISPTTMRAGSAHGQNSINEAEQTALGLCRRQGSADCRVLAWAQNQCQALAISYPEKTYGWSSSSARVGAAADAMARCRSSGGKSCQVITAPCAGDDVRFRSPMPLPPGRTTAIVDPNAVGTWELLINPGVWVWTISANGTFESHSLALDNAPSLAGTVSFSGGKWSFSALNTPWTDSGTYRFSAPGTMVATGKLGTGTWHKVSR